jgi:hypothetical protein
VQGHFFSFNEMFECLLSANSSVEVICDGLVSCFRSYGRSKNFDMEVVLALIESLLKANSTITDYLDSRGKNIFHWACHYLEGDLGPLCCHCYLLNSVIRLELV